jgi:SAM-dependent methyltransferase
MTLELVPCPLCGQSSSFLDVTTVPAPDPHLEDQRELYSGKTISEWKVCGSCGFVHQNPRPSITALNEFYLRAAYHSVKAKQSGAQHLEFARWYFSEKIDFTLKHSNLETGRVFDIGCGRGGVLKLYEERGWNSIGVEPDRDLAAFARDELGLQSVENGILDGNFSLPEKVDLIFSNHAFEHFADLNQVMSGVLNILKPGGYLFIAIPTYFRNRSSLSLDWMNSAHYSLFTRHTLNNLLARYGFEEVFHTYSGWNKEIDDLWYLAKFTGNRTDPSKHFENAQQVHRYIETVNPLRSLLYYPIYSHWAGRVRIYNAFKLLLKSPVGFFRKVALHFKQRVAAK